jgi:carbamate kinase
MDRDMDHDSIVVKPLVVVAVGGNALVGADQRLDVEAQRARAAEAAAHLARLSLENRLVVTHGNGPQVGLLALQSAGDPDVPAPPLDVLDAESVGLIDDPAFTRPTKPVGPWFPEGRAAELAAEHGWNMVGGPRGSRRVVPSPDPVSVVEIDAVDILAKSGRAVVAAGGGGIPVARRSGRLVGVEAVVDKDLTSSLLAVELGANRLIILTDVDAIHLDHGTPESRPLARATPSQLRSVEFEPGSMGPKVEAVCRFVESTGRSAAVGSLPEAEAVIAGASGTLVEPD